MLLFQPLNGLFLLSLQVFHFLVILTLLALVLTDSDSYRVGKSDEQNFFQTPTFTQYRNKIKLHLV